MYPTGVAELAAVLSFLGTGVAGLLAWKSQQTVQVMRAEAEKELARVGSDLRVRAEVRLRMFELGAQAVGKTIAACEHLTKFSFELMVQANVAGHRDKETAAAYLVLMNELLALDSAAAFLPPVLDSSAVRVRGAAATLLTQFHRIALMSDGNERDQAWVKASGAVGEAVAAFRKDAIAWKSREWPAENGALPLLPMKGEE